MKQKPSLTIAISAHNEAENIGYLLTDLFMQKISQVNLKDIIVVSDGSTDQTVNIARKYIPRVKVAEFSKRQGKSSRLNYIFSICKSHIVIVLDADTKISDRSFVDKLVAPLVKKQADMTSSALSQLPPRTFFENTLDVSMKLKRALFEEFKHGHNLYNCHGPARAFSLKLYKKIKFPQNSGAEDMYSYLACKAFGLKFLYIPHSQIYYRLPSILTDHSRQSLRYFQSLSRIRDFFGQDQINSELRIPTIDYLKAAVKSLPLILFHPVHTLVYMTVYFGLKLRFVFDQSNRNSWNTPSSKTAIHII